MQATGHTPGADATCTQPQTCDVCGAILKSENGHVANDEPDSVSGVVHPTCTKDGYSISIYLCKICKEEAKREKTTLKAPGYHEEETIKGYPPTETTDGLSDGKKCTVCGQITVPQTTILALGGKSVPAWDGSVATSFAGGSGTEEDPYLISSGAELAYLAEIINDIKSYNKSNYYKLTADINLGGRIWTPIGIGVDDKGEYSERRIFKGKFDGNGFTIYNFKVIQPEEEPFVYFGLFGRIEGSYNNYSEICNLTVEDISVDIYTRNDVYFGGIAGFARYTKFTNCSVYGNINIRSTINAIWAGGLLGNVEYVDIASCCTSVDQVVQANSVVRIGGLVGDTLLSKINTSYSLGSINVKLTSYVIAGGLVGDLGDSECRNSYSKTNVTVTVKGSSSPHVGGFVGETSADSILENCFATGNLDVQATYKGYIGGFAGYVACVAKNCLSRGYVFVEHTDPEHPAGIGGFAGGGEKGQNCYRLNIQGMAVTNSAPLVELSSTCTLEQLCSREFYETMLGWDASIWNFEDIDVKNGKYPSIKNIPSERLPHIHKPEKLEAVAPTCVENGLTEGLHCSVCLEILTPQEPVYAAGHVKEIIPGKAPTIDETGLTDGEICSVCKTILVPQEVIPNLDYDVWDGTVATEFGGGRGTKDDPYLITRASQLALLAQGVNGQYYYLYADKYYRLMIDINLDGREWIPIGHPERNSFPWNTNYANTFKGHFDGNSHKISNFCNSKRGYTEYVGIFGYIYGGSIKNLLIGNCNLTVEYGDSIGILAAIIENAKIEGCVATGYIEYDSRYSCSVGMLAGYVYESEIKNCSVWGDIRVFSDEEYVHMGGFIGTASQVTINDCFSATNLLLLDEYFENYIGGFIGTSGESSINNCFVTGYVLSYNPAYIGGFIAYSDECEIYNCYRIKGQEVYEGDYPIRDDTLPEVDPNEAKTEQFYSQKLRWDTNEWKLPGRDFEGGIYPYPYIDSHDEHEAIIIPAREPTLYAYGNTEGKKCKICGKILEEPVLIPALAFGDNVWKGDIADNFAGGSGTEDDPYLISNGAELALLAKLINENSANKYFNKHYKLIADINLGGLEWDPIGRFTFGDGVSAESRAFCGTFDGNGHTVSNFKITKVSNKEHKFYFGLFGYAINATFKDLCVESFDISITMFNDHYQFILDYGMLYAGGLVAYADNTYFENCSVSGAINTESAGMMVGGLVGRLENSSLVDSCSADVTINAFGSWGSSVGGLIGYAHYDPDDYFPSPNMKITNCHANIDIKAVANYIGGIVGSAWACTIEDSSAMGKISSPPNNISASVGGIIGELASSYDEAAIIARCHSDVDIHIENIEALNLGGIVGVSYAYGDDIVNTVINCYSTGTFNVSVREESYIGGISGYHHYYQKFVVENCYSSVNMTATGQNGVLFVGGISGSQDTSAMHCLTIGNITASGGRNTVAGGIVGNYGIKYSYQYRDAVLILNGKRTPVFTTDADICTAARLSTADFYSYLLGWSTDVWDLSDLNLLEGKMPTLKEKATEGPEHKHIEVIIPASEPTCTEPGFTEGIRCSECDTLLKAQVQIPALGHTPIKLDGWEPTEDMSGRTNGKQCATCKEILEKQEIIPSLSGNIPVWNGEIADKFAGGSGTETHPYLISNGAELALLAKLINENSSGKYYNKYYRLTKHIDLGGLEWTPIGTYKSYSSNCTFQGHFDGNGFTISNFKITSLDTTGKESYAGLFGRIYKGTVTDLRIKKFVIDVSTENKLYVGGLAGDANTGATLKEVYALGTINAASEERLYVGGLVGYVSSCEIYDCYANADIEATSNDTVYAGGLAGYSFQSTFTVGYAAGSVTAEGAGYTYAGGFVGLSVDKTKISRCLAFGKVSAIGDSNVFIGGLTYRSSGVTVSSCYRYNDQVILINGKPSTGDRSGTTATESEINSEDFYGYPLSWDRDIWNISVLDVKNGKYPEFFKKIHVHTEQILYEVEPTSTSTGLTEGKICSECGTIIVPQEVIPKIEANLWDGSVATGFAGGTGTESDPYLIENGAQLAYLAKMVNQKGNSFYNKDYRLTANIDLGGREWTPIGIGYYSEDCLFSGTFDGNGHTILNYKITKTNYGSVFGLFGNISGYGATVKDLNVRAFDFEISSPNGGYIGGLSGKIDKHASVENCTSKGKTKTNQTEGNYFIGGMIGASYDSKVENCHASGYINDISGSVGGLVGQASSNSVFERCSADVEIYGGAAVGGFVGYIWTASFNNCYASGNITTNNCGSIGGFAGNIISGGTITRSCATGNVYGEGTNWSTKAGGFLGSGDTKSTISGCMAFGNVQLVTDSTITLVGGFCSSISSTKVSNNFKYDKQTVLHNTTAKDNDTATVAKKVSASNLNESWFYSANLGWSEDVWDLSELDVENGKYPQLKK